MEHVVELDDRSVVSIAALHADQKTHVLKFGDLFAVLDRQGEIGPAGLGQQGLYCRGMRHLSRWELYVNERPPMLLNATMRQDNSQLIVEYTTPDIHNEGQMVLAKGTLHIARILAIKDETLFERVVLTNYAAEELQLRIEYRFSADFKDMFEVRGVHRDRRGELLDPEVMTASVALRYDGLDTVKRTTTITFDQDPEQIDVDRMVFPLSIGPNQEAMLQARIRCSVSQSEDGPMTRVLPTVAYDSQPVDSFEDVTTITTSNEQVNDWINRSVADLRMLTTATIYGLYPYAGVPWFSTPFGRDAIITALQMLWIQPQLAKGVLQFLAAMQGDEEDQFSESQPGKILHEMRDGEMSAMGEVPFRRYYGTVDATPLFIVLAGHYYRRTGDIALIKKIWSNIRRAISWIDNWGDADGDGFVEYCRVNDRGLVQQGWKDSDDSIFHADGRFAEGPIALCEVQGYVYEAKCIAAELCEVLGESQQASELRRQANELKEKFNSTFWLPSPGTYAIALDGNKKPCAVRSSNAGHLLFSGIVDSQHVATLVSTLMNSHSFNGWGIRTLAEGEPRYNPMSYHNGSVWPHDTAIVAAGLARYGYQAEASKLLTGSFEATLYLDLSRLPELYCGFPRLPGHGPTQYPVACSPQAWAAGSVFMFFQASLGLTFSPSKPQIRFDHPMLPDYLQWLKIQNLVIDSGKVDLTLRRHPRDVGLNVEQKVGDIDVVLIA